MRVQASSDEGVGLKLPERDPNHSDPQWFERDLDELESDDPVGLDPLPTQRHKTVPS